MGRAYAEHIETYPDAELPGILHSTIEGTDQEFKLFHEWYFLSKVTACPNGVSGTYRGIHEPLEEGTLYLVEPKESICVEEGAGGGASVMLFIAPTILHQAAGSTEAGAIRFRDWKCRDGEVLERFDEACLAIREKAPLLERQSRLAGFLSLLLERFAGKKPLPGPFREPSPGIETARLEIMARHAENLSLDSLAELAGLNRYSLTRAFTSHFGISPHDYLVKVRLGKAQDLIGLGAGFAEAAATVGFADQSHFIRHFKQVYKITPGEFWGDRRS